LVTALAGFSSSSLSRLVFEGTDDLGVSVLGGVVFRAAVVVSGEALIDSEIVGDIEESEEDEGSGELEIAAVMLGELDS